MFTNVNDLFSYAVLPALVDGNQNRIEQNRLTRGPRRFHRLSLPVETEVDLAIVRDRCASSAKTMLEGLGHSLGTQVTVPKKKKEISILFYDNGLARREPSEENSEHKKQRHAQVPSIGAAEGST